MNIPKIPNLHQQVYAKARHVDFNMDDWNTCRAAIVVELADEYGLSQTGDLHPKEIAQRVYAAHGYHADDKLFYQVKTKALADMKALAEAEREAQKVIAERELEPA